MHRIITTLADTIGEDFALGSANLLLLANVLENQINMILRGDRGRKGLIGHFLVDFLLSKGYRVEYTLHLLLLRPRYRWVSTTPVGCLRAFLDVPLYESHYKLPLFVPLRGHNTALINLLVRTVVILHLWGATAGRGRHST